MNTPRRREQDESRVFKMERPVLNYLRDSNVDTDAEREAKYKLREEDIEKTNAHNRKNGRTPVVRIDSGK